MILTKRASRIAAIVLGLTFFVTAGVDALGFHECPHHDAIGLPTSVQEAAPDHDGHAGHQDHTNHDSDGADADAAPAPADHGDHTGPCTCVGNCQHGGH